MTGEETKMDICGIWKIKEISVPTPEGVKTYSRDNMPEGEMYEDFKQMIDSLTEFVADGTLNALFFAYFYVKLGHLVGMIQVILIKPLYHLDRLCLLALASRIRVNPLKHERVKSCKRIGTILAENYIIFAVFHNGFNKLIYTLPL